MVRRSAFGFFFVVRIVSVVQVGLSRTILLSGCKHKSHLFIRGARVSRWPTPIASLLEGARRGGLQPRGAYHPYSTKARLFAEARVFSLPERARQSGASASLGNYLVIRLVRRGSTVCMYGKCAPEPEKA